LVVDNPLRDGGGRVVAGPVAGAGEEAVDLAQGEEAKVGPVENAGVLVPEPPVQQVAQDGDVHDVGNAGDNGAGLFEMGPDVGDHPPGVDEMLQDVRRDHVVEELLGVVQGQLGVRRADIGKLPPDRHGPFVHLYPVELRVRVAILDLEEGGATGTTELEYPQRRLGGMRVEERNHF
jgi:hypothetical protein